MQIVLPEEGMKTGPLQTNVKKWIRHQTISRSVGLLLKFSVVAWLLHGSRLHSVFKISTVCAGSGPGRYGCSSL
jgi:hypothetical protein